jgi:hypothetical protein
MAAAFGHLVGHWGGANGFRLMPTDPLREAPAIASVATAADGHDLLLRYTWEHPDDGPQDGVLLAAPAPDGPVSDSPPDSSHADGSPDGAQAVSAAWGDSWHQKPSFLVLHGSLVGRRLELQADYGGGWRWIIVLDGEHGGRLVMTMQNVVPAEYATEEVRAGPYPVMIAELRPASG